MDWLNGFVLDITRCRRIEDDFNASNGAQILT